MKPSYVHALLRAISVEFLIHMRKLPMSAIILTALALQSRRAIGEVLIFLYQFILHDSMAILGKAQKTRRLAIA